jgi:DNA-binding beta-propeller fold protein YncE
MDRRMDRRKAAFPRREAWAIACVLVCVVACALAWHPFVESHAQARAETQVSLSYIGQWGSHGDEPGQLDEPTCIATDRIGDAYIADAGDHYIEKFDTGGTPLLSFEDPSLEHPDAITVDSGGAIYVADSGRASASIYFPNGEHYRTLRLQARANSEEEMSIAVNDEGLIQILDADEGRVYLYNSRLRPVQSWKPAANAPNMRIRPQALASDSDGYLYIVADQRILKFTPRGDFVAQVATSPDPLSDEAAVSHDLIFAMGADGRMLHVWSTDGEAKLNIDLSPELGQGHRQAPALAVSPQKELLVLDAAAGRVLQYRINF